MNDNTEFWHVQLPSGSVSTMTLDELDGAFQSGNINEGTFVLKAGDTAWATLASLLGLEEAAAPPPPSRATAAPVYAAPSTPANFAVVNSLRPVVSDVDDDLDFDAPSFRSSKKRAVVVTMSIMAIAAVGVVVATFGSGRASATVGSLRALLSGAPVAAASPPPPAVPAAVEPPPPASPPPVAEAATAPAPERFDEAHKRALLEADKARASQQKTKMNATAPHRSSGYKSDSKVFHKGGDKYDPLNASL